MNWQFGSFINDLDTLLFAPLSTLCGGEHVRKRKLAGKASASPKKKNLLIQGETATVRYDLFTIFKAKKGSAAPPWNNETEAEVENDEFSIQRGCG